MFNKIGVSKNVLVLGFVSFLNDVSSEMIYPILPIFLTSVLGAPVAIVGLIEGFAEATASLLKVLAGWLSDKINRRKPFIVTGYALAASSKLLLCLAYTWPTVLFARFIDRFGKGTRTPTRDALIVESSEKTIRGRSFGVHQAFDTLGAVVGPLLSLAAIAWLGMRYRLIFFIAFIPACISIFVLLFFVTEVKKQHHTAPLKLNLNFNRPFILFTLVSALFALGNSSMAFLILRAQGMGFSVTTVILVYVLFNIVYTLGATPAGMLADKIGPRKVLLSSFVLFACVYLFFGLINTPLFIWLLFPLYGVYMALSKGVSKAYIAQLVSHDQLGTAFGVYQMITGLCLFAASGIAGLLWTYVSISAPFIFGSIVALAAALLFVLFETPLIRAGKA